MKADINDQNFRRIVVSSTALGFGLMLATLEAIRLSPDGFAVRISFQTIVVFLLGALAPLPLWKTVFDRSSKKKSKAVYFWSLVLVLIGLGSFLYPLRYVPSEKMGEILTGLIFAAGALTVVGFLLFGLIKLLEAGEPAESTDDPDKES